MKKKVEDRAAVSTHIKSICYAPTDINHALHRWKKILRCLLSCFTDYDIIFRPSPVNRDELIIREISTYFVDEPRIRVDMRTQGRRI